MRTVALSRHRGMQKLGPYRLLYGCLISWPYPPHTTVSVLKVVDVILVATEYKFKHLLASEVYGLLYVAFNVSFFCLAPQDQRVLYSILDWGKNAGAAAGTSIFLMVVFVPVSSLLFYAIFT